MPDPNNPRKIDISVTVSWTTPKGGTVEGVRHTTAADKILAPDDLGPSVSDAISLAGAGAEASFRRMLARYDEDHEEDE